MSICNKGKGGKTMDEKKKKIFDFFCRSNRWVHFGQEEMTEEQAEKYAKDFDLRYEEANK